MDIPQMMEITDIVQEGKNQKSFFFEHPIECRPGQFIMAWLPGIDEKPMAVSYWKKEQFAFTSQSIGKFTKALDSMKTGEKLGIRGPYGKSFSIRADSCVVGGGVGMASVSILIDKLVKSVIIHGARSKENLIFLDRFRDRNMILSTDDGSHGRKGFVTDLLGDVLNESPRIKIVYTCGPEMMMKRVYDICRKHKVECEASLERFMACGFGVCGKCMINDRITCIDGPVFNSWQLARMSEFGCCTRLKSGRKVNL